MSPDQIRSTCLRRLAEFDDRLEIPRPFDAAELARRVSTCLHHPIGLLPLPMPSGAPYGLTLITDRARLIAYEEHTSRVHRDHIIAHELAHDLLGHVGVEIDTDEAAGALFPNLSPELIRTLLGRTGVYTTVEELEAETMATVLLELGNQRPPTPGDRRGDQPTGVAERLRSTLEHQRS